METNEQKPKEPTFKSKNEFVSWKDWRQNKRKQLKQWKEEKQIKKLKKLDDAKKEEPKKEQCSDGEVVVPSKGRQYTVSIAIPGSVMDNAQSMELKTYLAGQVARAAAVFNVDEIVVFDDFGLTRKIDDGDEEAMKFGKKHQGYKQMVRILQYLECPQYLRKFFFPMHKDLEYAGLLNPLDIPHHLRVEDECKYREGVVLNKPVKERQEGKGCFVYIGLKKTAVIDTHILPNIRVTIKLDEEQPLKKHLKGKAVSPGEPSKKEGLYWGYNVRLAKTFSEVFSGCPYKEGYDLILGTSDKGDNIDTFTLTPFTHLMIVFGGLSGLEACLDADETLKEDDVTSLFHHYLNTCPNQGSRTIRTEEAILITLSTLRPNILQVNSSV